LYLHNLHRWCYFFFAAFLAAGFFAAAFFGAALAMCFLLAYWVSAYP